MSAKVTLTVAQVAERLGISPKYVRTLIKRGELKASNVGSSHKPLYRIRQQAVETLLDDRTVTGIEG